MNIVSLSVAGALGNDLGYRLAESELRLDWISLATTIIVIVVVLPRQPCQRTPARNSGR